MQHIDANVVVNHWISMDKEIQTTYKEFLTKKERKKEKE